MPTDVLPGSEDQRANKKYWVENDQPVAHVVVPSVSKAYSLYDFVIFGPICGISDQPAEIGEEMSIYAEEGLKVQTDQLDTAGDYSTPGTTRLYYDETSDFITSVNQLGRYEIGYLLEAIDADGVIAFEKRRYWIAGEGT